MGQPDPNLVFSEASKSILLYPPLFSTLTPQEGADPDDVPSRVSLGETYHFVSRDHYISITGTDPWSTLARNCASYTELRPVLAEKWSVRTHLDAKKFPNYCLRVIKELAVNYLGLDLWKRCLIFLVLCQNSKRKAVVEVLNSQNLVVHCHKSNGIFIAIWNLISLFFDIFTGTFGRLDNCVNGHGWQTAVIKQKIHGFEKIKCTSGSKSSSCEKSSFWRHQKFKTTSTLGQETTSS